MAATTGLGILATALNAAWMPAARSMIRSGLASDISWTSAPAAKIRSPPYKITAWTSGSALTSAAAAPISFWTWPLSAFIFGRSSRMVAMPPSVSTWTKSPMTASQLPAFGGPASQHYSLSRAPGTSAQVAVGHSGRRFGHGDQAELGPAGQQRVPGQSPDRVAERPGLGQLDRARVPHRSPVTVVPRGEVGRQRQVGRGDQLGVLGGQAGDDLDADVVGGQLAPGDRDPDGERRAQPGLARVGFDVLDAHGRPS